MATRSLYLWLTKQSNNEPIPLSLPQAIVASYCSLYQASLATEGSIKPAIEFCTWSPGQHPATQVPLPDLVKHDIPDDFASELKPVDWSLLPLDIQASEPIRWVQTLPGKTHGELLTSLFKAPVKQLVITFQYVPQLALADHVITWFLRLMCDDVKIHLIFPSSGCVADLTSCPLPLTERYLRFTYPDSVRLALDWPGPSTLLQAACATTSHLTIFACIDLPRPCPDMLKAASQLKTLDISSPVSPELVDILQNAPVKPLTTVTVDTGDAIPLPITHLLGSNTELSVSGCVLMTSPFRVGTLKLTPRASFQVDSDDSFQINELHCDADFHQPTSTLWPLLKATDVVVFRGNVGFDSASKTALDCLPNISCVRMTDRTNCSNTDSHQDVLSRLKTLFPNAVLDYQVQAYGRVLLGLGVYGPRHVLSDRHLGKLRLNRAEREQQLNLAIALDLLHLETEQVAPPVFNRILQWSGLVGATMLQPGLQGYLLSLQEYRELVKYLTSIPARGMTAQERAAKRGLFVHDLRARAALKAAT
eukprot:m.144482 g.144482  ORF g.144482 m.144482 type:complete len:534 (+) comp16199_c0_seq1:74-1675(+)